MAASSRLFALCTLANKIWRTCWWVWQRRMLVPGVPPALPPFCCCCQHQRHSRPLIPCVPALQGFAEKLVTQLNVRYKQESWETRLAMMSLAARVVGVHKLVSLLAAVLGLVPHAMVGAFLSTTC